MTTITTWAVSTKEKRKAFRQATLAAWQAYLETGLHVTGKEADDWLIRLAEGQDVEPPSCHR
jgi:predicted transcriptional regulator